MSSHLLGMTQLGFSQVAVAAFVTGLLFLSGCASAPASSFRPSRPSTKERAGLLDVWRKMESPRAPSRDSRKNDSPDRGIAQAPSDLKFRWPLESVEVTSKFGSRNGDFHEGIDLRAPQGTPVYAAQSGTVLYADSRIGGYGRMVVIGHRKGVATVYAHNSKILVKRGQKVLQGSKIAFSGKSGRVTGPHLHFEVRSGTKPVDPMKVLPDRLKASGQAERRRDKSDRS